MYTHTFAICAYKESPFLEECIKSVINQTVPGEVFIATSTPNAYISALAEKYNLRVYVNSEKKGITEDWNYAYNRAETRFVTITHQDDVYMENYREDFLKMVGNREDMLIYFTDYGEIRDGRFVDSNRLLKVKRMLLRPLRDGKHSNSVFIRRRVLSLGCPICCPSVTFDRKNIPDGPFVQEFRSDEDWQAWELLSRRKGAYIYNSSLMMRHRIHEDSETTAIIGDGDRNKEDLIMFRKFWPSCIAGLLAKLYSKSEGSNNL